MLKVALILRQLLLWLKESEVEAFIHKQKETIRITAIWRIETSNPIRDQEAGVEAQPRIDAQ